MPYVDIVTALALLQFTVFGFQVGGARGRYDVKAPSTSGNEIFELYASTYVKDPAKRGLGFGLSFLPTGILIVGGLIGAVSHLARA